MIDHLSTYAKDFALTRDFYKAVLGALGYEIEFEMQLDADEELPNRKICAWGPPGRSVFWVIESKSAIEPRHTAFTAEDRGAVDRFHSVGLATGATDGGAPGLRPIYHPDYYGAFLLDPDGNNVEAVCHTPPS